jgi:hypothetical protein
MKFDKEALIKHKFWVILGVFALLWLIGLGVMLFTLSDRIKLHRDAYEGEVKSADGALKSGPKNPATFLPPWQEHQKMFRDHKNVIWGKAWEVQKAMYDWPHNNIAPLDTKMQDPSDPLDFKEREEYKNVLYDLQMEDFRKRHDPAPVEFLKDFNAVIVPMVWTRGGGEDSPPPTREEIWLAQEDYWVKRDLVDVIRSVGEELAKLEQVQAVRPTDKDAKEKLDKDGDLGRFRFRNGSWELDLIIEAGKEQRDRFISGRSSIKNIHPGKRTLNMANPATQEPLKFIIEQGPGNEVDLLVTGEPLAYGQSVKLQKPIDLLRIKPTEDFTVKQVFDWYASPIKRIDKVLLGYQSARTVTTPLKPNPALPPDPSEAAAPAAAAPGAAPAGGASKPMTGPPGGAGGTRGVMPGATGGNEESKTLKYSMERNRYLQVTPQCRHLPLALVLVVDQAHIPDVMAAIANSRLRIQVTQVQIGHARGVKPQVSGGPAKPSTEQAPAVPVAGGPALPPAAGGVRQLPGAALAGRLGRVGGARGGEGRPNPAVPAAVPQPGSPGTNAVITDTDDPNLVELAIYGIAALYERFDANKAVDPLGAPPASPKK